MDKHNPPLKPQTISRLVREGRMTERGAALLRGSAAQRGFRGPVQASLRWLEDRAPGAIKLFYGDRMKGWKRNIGPARAALVSLEIQGRLPKPRHHYPPSKDRCAARSKRTGEQCKQWAHPKGDGTRYRTCWYHGGPGGKHGGKSMRQVMKWDGTQHRKMWIPVRRSDKDSPVQIPPRPRPPFAINPPC